MTLQEGDEEFERLYQMLEEELHALKQRCVGPAPPRAPTDAKDEALWGCREDDRFFSPEVAP